MTKWQELQDRIRSIGFIDRARKRLLGHGQPTLMSVVVTALASVEELFHYIGRRWNVGLIVLGAAVAIGGWVTLNDHVTPFVVDHLRFIPLPEDRVGQILYGVNMLIMLIFGAMVINFAYHRRGHGDVSSYVVGVVLLLAFGGTRYLINAEGSAEPGSPTIVQGECALACGATPNVGPCSPAAGSTDLEPEAPEPEVFAKLPKHPAVEKLVRKLNLPLLREAPWPPPGYREIRGRRNARALVEDPS